MLLDPEKTLFVRGATPVLLLADASASVHDALPVVTAPGPGAVPLCEGWSIVPKLTLCVVDGPGDVGGLIPAFAAPVIDGSTNGTNGTNGTDSTEPADMADWCADAERAGGVVVLSLDHLSLPLPLPAALDWARLLASGTARGGFMPSLV
ncbi:hypothetical protein D7231_09775 [Streptomyces klenkii]|uniref:Uncharacterized protein n=1 Tax=Streptomyces klenkii TaxID=1420899 RepID=A0A3B0BQW1_9ACTN|nr:hypothetical protein [Streptomyces klenkii]RKN75675.1 hypothetical protein D7231_09775 [Streptomyces klenkii]